MAGAPAEALIDPWEEQDAAHVAEHDGKRVSAGLPTIGALVADVLADQDAIDAVIGALEEAGHLWHVNHSERSMAESAICRIMVTLTQYGFMTASEYRPGDDVTPDFSQTSGELIAEAVSALSEIIGDSADDYVAQACEDYGFDVERDGHGALSGFAKRRASHARHRVRRSAPAAMPSARPST
jgi:hypothetical protein